MIPTRFSKPNEVSLPVNRKVKILNGKIVLKLLIIRRRKVQLGAMPYKCIQSVIEQSSVGLIIRVPWRVGAKEYLIRVSFDMSSLKI